MEYDFYILILQIANKTVFVEDFTFLLNKDKLKVKYDIEKAAETGHVPRNCFSLFVMAPELYC